MYTEDDKIIMFIFEWFELEGTFKDHPVPTCCHGRDTFHWNRLLRTLSRLALKTSRAGASTISQGNLFQCFTTLTGKIFSPDI